MPACWCRETSFNRISALLRARRSQLPPSRPNTVAVSCSTFSVRVDLGDHSADDTGSHHSGAWQAAGVKSSVS